MALSNNTLPSILPTRVLPVDQNLIFATNQTLTASGYVNNVNTQLDIGLGRYDGYLVLDISNMKISTTDETYFFYLLGSNDASWTSGNVETICAKDFAGLAANRAVPTICPASYAVPATGRSSTRWALPFTNEIGTFVFRYLQLRVIIGGTSPTVSLSSFVTIDAC